MTTFSPTTSTHYRNCGTPSRKHSLRSKSSIGRNGDFIHNILENYNASGKNAETDKKSVLRFAIGKLEIREVYFMCNLGKFNQFRARLEYTVPIGEI